MNGFCLVSEPHCFPQFFSRLFPFTTHPCHHRILSTLFLSFLWLFPLLFGYYCFCTVIHHVQYVLLLCLGSSTENEKIPWSMSMITIGQYDSDWAERELLVSLPLLYAPFYQPGLYIILVYFIFNWPHRTFSLYIWFCFPSEFLFYLLLLYYYHLFFLSSRLLYRLRSVCFHCLLVNI